MKNIPDQDIVDQINQVFHGMIKSGHRHMHSTPDPLYEGVIPPDIGILMVVSNNPDIILKEILEKFNMPNSTLTSLINRLEKLNILKRVISERDRRSYGLKLLEKGHLIVKDHKIKEDIYFRKIAETLDTDEERQTLVRLMNKIIDGLDKIPPLNP